MSTQLFFAKMTAATILTGQSASRVINMLQEASDAEAIAVEAPSNIDGKTYTWEGSVDNGVTFATIKDTAGTNIIVPGTSALIIYNGVFTAITHLRIRASANVSVDVTFLLGKNFRG